MTERRRQMEQAIAECEAKGTFDAHTDPPELDLALPVDGSYDYLQERLSTKLKAKLAHFISVPQEKKILRNLFQLQVEGREHLAGVQNAVVVCNHVHRFDCVAVRSVFGFRDLYITAAEFNNRKDRLGFLMRYNGLLPFSSDHAARRNLERAIDKILHRKRGFVLFFPEASEWQYYKKPRPCKIGAFHYAAKHGVPVLLMFLTFADTGRTDEVGDPAPDATLHILPPLYPDSSLTRRDAAQRLRDAAEAAWRAQYCETYEEA